MPFCSLIYDNIVLVSRALRNQFIIPDWESFTATIRGFYDKVKAMDSVGHVSTLTGTEKQRGSSNVARRIRKSERYICFRLYTQYALARYF